MNILYLSAFFFKSSNCPKNYKFYMILSFLCWITLLSMNKELSNLPKIFINRSSTTFSLNIKQYHILWILGKEKYMDYFNRFLQTMIIENTNLVCDSFFLIPVLYRFSLLSLEQFNHYSFVCNLFKTHFVLLPKPNEMDDFHSESPKCFFYFTHLECMINTTTQICYFYFSIQTFTIVWQFIISF